LNRTICILTLMLLIVALPGLTAQQPPMPTAQQPSPPTAPDNGMGIPPEMQKQMQKKANEQRHAQLKRDAEKLLKLSTELKEYVDKTNENVLSLDVIKKAEEIEKLAHSVKVKMRGSDYGGN
jgi:hypothetical protein